MSINLNKRRVVVTGLGVVSSIGIGIDEFWKNLLAGKSGISKVSSFDVSKHDRKYAGEVKNFDPQEFVSKRKIPFMGRASQLAIAASKLALKDAGLKVKKVSSSKTGVCMGTTMGEPQIMETLDEECFLKKEYVIDKNSAFSYPASSIVNNISLDYGLNKRTILFSNACAAGNYSIGHALDLIRSGKADMMFAGGADAFSRISFTGFSRLYAMAPEKCQPFDKNRKGMIPAEGAGMLLLETYESAKRRGARIYAEVLGYGLSCDAHHMTNPSSKGIAKAIKKAVDNANVNPFQIDYISAHGTGTPENDKAECKAIKSVLGKRVKDIPISSIKSMLGHTMGAAAAIEAVACCLAIYNREVPPTINFEEKDPECDIDCVPNKSRKMGIDVALNNSSAFGGNNCCVVFKKV